MVFSQSSYRTKNNYHWFLASDDKDEKGSIFLVFEFMEHDLAGLMDQPSYKYWKPMHIKCYIKQLLVGLHELHHNNILHRDIKGVYHFSRGSPRELPLNFI